MTFTLGREQASQENYAMQIFELQQVLYELEAKQIATATMAENNNANADKFLKGLEKQHKLQSNAHEAEVSNLSRELEKSAKTTFGLAAEKERLEKEYDLILAQHNHDVENQAALRLELEERKAALNRTIRKHNLYKASLTFLRCGICLGPASRPSLLACGHMFCFKCITEWWEKADQKGEEEGMPPVCLCPNCRAPLNSKPKPFYNNGYDAVYNGVKEYRALKGKRMK
ncbi:hypothetical protein DXG01_010721 [Tephrocybe rancida]|nr:hypothetical protein DXG01_010721 [Tephrocybe rancida]